MAVKARLSCSTGTTGNPAVTVTSGVLRGASAPFSASCTSGTLGSVSGPIKWKATGGKVNPSSVMWSAGTASGTSTLVLDLPGPGTATVSGSNAGENASMHIVSDPLAGGRCSKSAVKGFKFTGTGGTSTVSIAPFPPPPRTLWAWGNNFYGQLGDGTTSGPDCSGSCRTMPEQIGTDAHWAQVSSGDSHTMAVKTDGTLWAWGNNGLGQLGDGGTTAQSSPEQIGTDTHWAQVSAGGLHTVAVKTDGTLWTWGFNFYGQLGDGTTTDAHSPEQIGTDTHWAQVGTGTYHTVAVKTDGTLWAWGRNDEGRLGDSTTTEQHSPEQIGTDTHWARVSAGGYHTVAVKTDGTLWAWGRNNEGQLGNGTNTGPQLCGPSSTIACSTSPEQIGTDTHWARVSAGQFHTEAVKTDGTLWAWGQNAHGELGDGTNSGPQFCGGLACSTSPEQIGTDTHWAQVSAAGGGEHTVAVKTDGTLWVWGYNGYGRLGDSTTTERHSPEQIGTDTHWAQVGTGADHTVAVKT